MDIKKIIKESLVKVLGEAKKDLFPKNRVVSINSIKKYLKGIKPGITIHLNKKISYTKVEDNVFTSDKYTDLGLDQLANVMDQAFRKKQKVQVEEHVVTFTKDEMSKLHKDGKITKKDEEGKDHDYVYNEEFELEKEKMTDPDDMRMYNEVSTLGASKAMRIGRKLGWEAKKRSSGRTDYVTFTKDGKEYGPVDANVLTKDYLIKKLSETLNEASLSKVYNAARKGSYPITLVAIEKGKVVDQKLVGTPEIVPAAFNDMQKEFPKAQVNVEDRKGKILFKEDRDFNNPGSKPTMKQLKPLLKKGSTVTIKDGLAKLVDFYNEFYEFGHESTDKISDNLSKAIDALRDKKDKDKAAKLLKKFNKDSKDALRKGINESKYKVAGKSVTLNKGKKSDGTDWTVTFNNGKTASLSDVLALIKPLPKGIKEDVSDIGNQPIPSKYFKKYMREYSSEITQAKRHFIKSGAWPIADKVRKYLKSGPTPTTVDEYIKWHAGAKALTGGKSFGMGSGFASASSLISTIVAESGTTNKQANLWDSKILPYIDKKAK